MTEYPVSLDTFKTYFMREAGLEYQPYPTYDAEVTYNTGNKVIAIVNYKPSVWESLKDDNDGTPGVDDGWELDDSETENLDSVILDADILRAMGEASFKFSVSLFPENRLCLLPMLTVKLLNSLSEKLLLLILLMKSSFSLL